MLLLVQQEWDEEGEKNHNSVFCYLRQDLLPASALFSSCVFVLFCVQTICALGTFLTSL